MIRSTLIAFAAAGLIAAATAETDPAAYGIGPVVGQPAPGLEGTVVVTPETALAAETPNGTVIAFVRSADWCPYCKTQLQDLNAATAPLAEAGWGLAALSYDSPETLSGFAEANGLTYKLLSDEGSETIRAFGLFNDEIAEGSRFHGIPHPAVVFIRTDGTVGAVLREEDYRERPKVEAILDTARLLNAAAAAG